MPNYLNGQMPYTSPQYNSGGQAVDPYGNPVTPVPPDQTYYQEGSERPTKYFDNPPEGQPSQSTQAAKSGTQAAGSALMMTGNPWLMGAGVALEVGSALIGDSGHKTRAQKAQEQQMVNQANVSSAAWRVPYSNEAEQAIAKSQGKPGVGMAQYVALTGGTPSREDAIAMLTGGASNPRQVAANEAAIQQQQQQMEMTRLRRRRALQMVAPLAIVPFAMLVRRSLL